MELRIFEFNLKVSCFHLLIEIFAFTGHINFSATYEIIDRVPGILQFVFA